jgi:hypothetical protein
MGTRFNIFSGARRLAVVLTALVSGGLAIGAAYQAAEAFMVEVPKVSAAKPLKPWEEYAAAASASHHSWQDDPIVVESSTQPGLFVDLIPTRETKLKERAAHLDNAKDMALGALGFAVFVWVFSAAVGWVVRGLLGVPAGLDHKTE